MEDGPGAEAVVVVVRWSDFKGNACASGLAAETAVKAQEEVRGWCHVRQGLKARRGVRPATLWLCRRVCREIGISSCLTSTGDSLKKVRAGGDSAGVPRRGLRCVGAAGAKGVLSPSDGLIVLVILPKMRAVGPSVR
ncbi:hypothetical protein IEO21_10272 [Rhodonia placenta]|uniref:Uncharacterized protein n=1 Tax=Rhodonia placenta TaxID=104341 RepID=A0A8H7NST2_9APHY|nr:hypothetical protein IEO21_10272 [Postia placenta]